LKYVVAKSFPKMVHRIEHERSWAFLECLTAVTFTYKPAPESPLPNPLDETFFENLPKLASRCKLEIPFLLALARCQAKDRPQLYSAETCEEFHTVLIEVLKHFHLALQHLNTFRHPEGQASLESIVNDVLFYGLLLHTIVYGSMIESHLQGIADLLVLLYNKHIQAGPNKGSTDGGEEAEEEDTELAAVQPRTMQEDGPLTVWQSFRDWLRLMVSFFESARNLCDYVTHYCPSSISVKVVAIPNPGQLMVPLYELPSKFFPSMETPAVPGDTETEEADIPEDSVSSEDLTSSVSSREELELTSDFQWATNLRGIINIGDFIKAIRFVSNNSEYFQTKFRSTSALFKGTFWGTLHCEACIASLIYLSEKDPDNKRINEDIRSEFSVSPILYITRTSLIYSITCRISVICWAYRSDVALFAHTF
jgi:hypothetical protein